MTTTNLSKKVYLKQFFCWFESGDCCLTFFEINFVKNRCDLKLSEYLVFYFEFWFFTSSSIPSLNDFFYHLRVIDALSLILKLHFTYDHFSQNYGVLNCGCLGYSGCLFRIMFFLFMCQRKFEPPENSVLLEETYMELLTR